VATLNCQKPIKISESVFQVVFFEEIEKKISLSRFRQRFRISRRNFGAFSTCNCCWILNTCRHRNTWMPTCRRQAPELSAVRIRAKWCSSQPLCGTARRSWPSGCKTQIDTFSQNEGRMKRRAGQGRLIALDLQRADEHHLSMKSDKDCDAKQPTHQIFTTLIPRTTRLF